MSSSRSNPRRSHAATVRRAPIWVSAVIGTLLAGGACQSNKKSYKSPIFTTQEDVDRYTHDALYDADADNRRRAIEQLSKTRFADAPGVVDAFAVVARTDESDAVRCAAVRALGRFGRAEAVTTLVALLTDLNGARGIRPCGASVRWEAMKELQRRMGDGSVAVGARATVRDVAIDRLARDASRDVRMAAARLLGFDASIESLRALVAALRSADFGIAYAADRSLMRLTGESLGPDADAWTHWVESSPNPFANRGALIDTLDSSSSNGWLGIGN